MKVEIPKKVATVGGTLLSISGLMNVVLGARIGAMVYDAYPGGRLGHVGVVAGLVAIALGSIIVFVVVPLYDRPSRWFVAFAGLLTIVIGHAGAVAGAIYVGTVGVILCYIAGIWLLVAAARGVNGGLRQGAAETKNRWADSKSTILCFVALCLPITATAQQSGFQDALLDHLAGTWVLRGTIAGTETTHDIVSEWVLGHYYLRLHEVSREKSDRGEPAYEAIVFIGWDEKSKQYVCLWLDSTGGSGLTAQAFGYAKKNGDDLAFVFTPGDGSIIYTTFAYNRGDDTWQWLIDVERDGKRNPFARVTLTRQ